VAGVELIVTDLDGTLWGPDERIHERTLGALAALQARGPALLVATGRRLRSATDALSRSGLTLPMVVLDGALGRVDGRTFHETAFQPEAARGVLAAFKGQGIEPCVYVDLPEVDVFVGERPSTSPRHLERIGRWLGRDDLERVVARERVLSFGVAAGDPAVLAAVLRDVAGIAAGSVTRDLVYGRATLMVRPSGVSKWQGVLAWCADQGLDPGRVLAVGDGENDIELLTSAAVAVAVCDGSDGALALADHVIAPPGEGGWSQILRLATAGRA
jgi:hydroxymethylpyrimidine pyrophosphatase-like HAD family hydrolase